MRENYGLKTEDLGGEEGMADFREYEYARSSRSKMVSNVRSWQAGIYQYVQSCNSHVERLVRI